MRSRHFCQRISWPWTVKLGPWLCTTSSGLRSLRESVMYLRVQLAGLGGDDRHRIANTVTCAAPHPVDLGVAAEEASRQGEQEQREGVFHKTLVCSQVQ